MSAQALADTQLLIDLADELAEDPELDVVQLGEVNRFDQPQYVLQVWAKDIARLSTQSFPCIQVLGAQGGIVQLCDPRQQCQAAQWQRQLKDPDYPGVTIYSCHEGGKSIQLVVQDSIHVYDADGARM